jgi:hypothetical protein
VATPAKERERIERELEQERERMVGLIAAHESEEEKARRYIERGYGCKPHVELASLAVMPSLSLHDARDDPD